MDSNNNWRDIATAPTDGTPILVCDKDGEIDIAAWYHFYGYSTGGWYLDNNGQQIEEKPLYWQPLPLKPKQQ